MYFQPTQAEIKAAQKVLITRAAHSLAKADYERIAKEVLETGTFYYDDSFYTESNIQKFNLPTDRILRNPAHLDMIRITRYGYSHNDQSHCAFGFQRTISPKMTEAGYRFADCALGQISNAMHNAEYYFFNLTRSIGIQPYYEHSVNVDHAKRINTLLNYFSSIDLLPYFHQRELHFFNNFRVVELSEQENYLADEASFQKFLAYKRFIPIADFLCAQNRIDALPIYQHVEGLWAYTPHCFIYQIAAGKEWQTSNGKRYMMDEITSGFTPGNSLPDLERQLYHEFLRYKD